MLINQNKSIFSSINFAYFILKAITELESIVKIHGLDNCLNLLWLSYVCVKNKVISKGYKIWGLFLMFFWFDINNAKSFSKCKSWNTLILPYCLFFRDFSSYCKSILHNWEFFETQHGEFAISVFFFTLMIVFYRTNSAELLNHILLTDDAF